MNFKKILAGIAGLIIVSVIGLFILISSYVFSDQIDKIADLVYARTGRKFEIKGKTDLSIGLTPSLVLENLSFANAAWSDTPEMIKADRFEVQLDLISLLKGNVVIKRFVLRNSEILIEKNQHGIMNTTFTPEHQKKDKNQKNEDRFSNIVFKEFIIDDCKIIFHDAKGEKPRSLIIKRIKAMAIDLNTPVGLNIIANYDHLNISAKGSIGAIASLLKKEQKYPFELNTNINDSDINLKGNIIDAFRGPTPRILLDIHSNQLKMASFLAPEPDTKKVKSQKPNTNDKVFSSDKINNKFLGMVNLEADINISEIVLNNISTHNIKAKMVMEKGKLVLSPLNASSFNGNLSGTLTIMALKKDLTINSVLTVQNLDTRVMSKQLELKKGLKGLVNGKFQLQGNGNSIARIMADLNGFSWISMKDGEVETGFAQSLGTDIVTNILGFLNPFDEKTESNKLNCTALRMEFTKGLGEIKLLLADTPLMFASGKGQIDLRDETLDISVKLSPKKGIGTKELGNINLSLSRLAKAFKIGGTLKSPEINIDHAEATKSLAKTVGGIVLFGPAGIVATLVGVSKADQNPCPCALVIAMDGNDKNCNTSKNNKKLNPDTTSNPIKKLFNIIED